MPGLIGRKIGMTSYYTPDGRNVACTVVEAGPCVVTQLRTSERDGYEAVQLGFEERKEKHTAKPQLGSFQKAGLTPMKVLKEFRGKAEYSVGDQVTVDFFKEGDKINVVGTSKGKGFQGVVKRHGFGGVGGQTHGQHNRQRHPGSIGACSTPSRVFKGMRMAGRTGGDRVTQRSLKVVRILADENLILISGAVPGANNSVVYLNK